MKLDAVACISNPGAQMMRWKVEVGGDPEASR